MRSIPGEPLIDVKLMPMPTSRRWALNVLTEPRVASTGPRFKLQASRPKLHGVLEEVGWHLAVYLLPSITGEDKRYKNGF